MAWVSAAISVGGGLIGAYGANKNAKADAAWKQKQLEAQMAGFNQSKPYVDEMFKTGQDQKNKIIADGAYQGNTLTDMNNMSSDGYNYINNAANSNMGNASSLMNSGSSFGTNYGDLYGKANSGTQMADASKYAMDNARPLHNAAMRDDFRNLSENTLTGIDRNASGSANLNSSRAGIETTGANRAYDDRSADTYAGINQGLREQYLDQNNASFANSINANKGLQDAYGTGMDSTGAIADWKTKAGSAFQNQDQAVLNDKKKNYYDAQNHGLDTNIKYNSGILNNAVYNSPTTPIPQNSNIGTATAGGFMSGFGTGGELAESDWFKNYLNSRKKR